jgi:uncharacterized protein YbjT (DUF2867 family)
MFVIAGVTGHVGSVVANELLAKKMPVTVIVRDLEKGTPWAKKGAQVAVGRLQDQAFLTATLKGAEGFFTLLPPDFSSPDFYAAQRTTADAIAAAVKASGVPHVVILSSVGADLPSGTGPIRGLHYLENVLRGTGTTLSAIRAGYFQENAANSLAPARQAGIFPNFTASADYPVPMIATRDIGMLAAKSLLDKPKKSENVDLQGPAYSIRQVAEKLGAALGKTLKIVDIPPSGWVEAMKKGGIPEHVAIVFAEMYAGFASGAIKPKGDRLVQGKTELDEVIRAITS